MLSLVELRRTVRILERRLSGTRLQRVVQYDNFRMALLFRGPAGSHRIVLSCRPNFARIAAVEQMPENQAVCVSFVQFLRARLIGSTFESARVLGEDRQAGIRLGTGEGIYEILLSILGARSNLYALDSGATLVHSMRPLHRTRRELEIGKPWVNPSGGLPSAGADRWEEVPDEHYLEAVEKTYLSLEYDKKVEATARRIEGALAKEIAFLDRKAVNLLQDLSQARQAEKYKRRGEMLKTVLHTVRPGQDRVVMTDYETGEQVEIRLDPNLTPAKNLEAYFLRYQKISKRAEVLQQQLADLQRRRSETEASCSRLKAILKGAKPDLRALEDFASEPNVRKLAARYSPARGSPTLPVRSSAKRTVPGRLLPKRYKTGDMLEIWVGRSDEGNDYLTMRLARGNDLFFHLEGYPGSHVVLRTEGRTDAPSESILDACALAVHFSKLKHATRADIHMAPVKFVRKPRGAKPGLVYVAGGRTIHFRCDPGRLQDILASRLDE